MAFEAKVSKFTIYRLSTYLRVLSLFEKERRTTITSLEIGKMTCTPDTQVRKDLAYFGQFGISGKGYNVAELKNRISRILGTCKIWRVVLVGFGSLGRALLAYPGFKELGFNFVAVLDNNEEKIGNRYSDVVVQDMKNIKEIVSENGIKIGIITVPADAAQQVSDELVKAGVECILNFAPARLRASSNIRLSNIDLASELVQFSYFLTNKSSTA